MKNIKNIIVATDFSVTSRQAYRYAVELAETLQASLTVVHVIENVVMLSDVVSTPFLENDDQELIKDVKEMIAEEKEATAGTATNQHVKIKILKGDVVDVLTDLSKNKETDLIVIGTTGLSDVLEKIFGSISVKVSNKAHCPVIMVPRGAKWKPIEKIVYASDFDSLTAEFSKDIIGFSLNIDATIHFVNVRNYDPVGEHIQKDIDWNQLFVGTESLLSYEKHTIYGNNTIKELKEFAEEKKIDLIVFASKHRNFWQNLIHKSTTENMALSAITPIMVIHSDDQR